MTSDRWRRTEALFHAAVALPRSERAEYLDHACGGDVSLRRDVESLLAAGSSDDGFLETPAVRLEPRIGDATAPALVGRSLGPYRLEAFLAAGGMGEVYRAHDTRLGRDVAIKILPRTLTADADRLARFEREARMLAALNHPNICAIYGLENADGVTFLVLEFVDGPTLAARIAGVPLPLTEALGVARQIADALEAAHERGIIHRDLKPANINVTSAGTVKVLDFGLAKPVEAAGSPDLSRSGESGGVVVGTAAYMSPEQARGATLDKRTDIWAFGCVLFEMLAGRRAFPGDTVSEAIAKILERDPDWSAMPSTTPPRIRELLRRCLTKDPKLRLRDIGDARLEIDEFSRAAIDERFVAAPRRVRLAVLLPYVALAAASAVAIWALRRPTTPSAFDGAQFSAVTDWDGAEALADISPDGRFVVFLSDRAGELDLWRSQLGTDHFTNLTEAAPTLDTPGVLRTFGFSGDGAEVWFGGIGRPNMAMPQTDGAARPFLAADAKALAWSPDGSRIAYFTPRNDGDPLWIADRSGLDPRQLEIAWPDAADRRLHNHNPAWSPDGEWIYFVHGVVREWNHASDEMDIWRIRPAGGTPERLTRLATAIAFVTPIDARTLAYVAPDRDGSGSWLWSFDIATGTSRRMISGLEQFTSVAASRDGTRLVATRARPAVTLWTAPILDRPVTDEDLRPFGPDVKRAAAPRFGGASLFYLSARGTGDGLWRVTGGRAIEVHRGAPGMLRQAPAPSPSGEHVAVVLTRGHQHVLTIMTANGTDARTLAPSLDVHGTPGWSPDGRWLAIGAVDAQGRPGLFKVATDGAQEPIRIADGESTNPVWSPDGTFIVYAGPFTRGQADLTAVDAQGGARDFPAIRVSPGGYRFLPNGALVYLPRPESLDFWLLDLRSGHSRQLSRLSNQGSIRRFDISPDGTRIVFDRERANSDVVLIERPKS